MYTVCFRLIELEKAVVEGAGATGLAAVMAGMLPELRGKKSALKMNHQYCVDKTKYFGLHPSYDV